MKTTINYKGFVLATNSMLKAEYSTLSGAVKTLCNMENMPTDVQKALKGIADRKPITSASGRHNIVVNITKFAKGDNTAILRKATKAEISRGATEFVEKSTFSPYWVLQQLYKMNK